MSVALSAVKWQFALFFINDIVVFSCSAVEHIDHFKHVSTLSPGADVTLKLMKCNFFTETIHALGHVFCCKRLEIACQTNYAIKELNVARDGTNLNFFLDSSSVFRRFVQDFVECASLPSDKLQKKQL